MDYDIGTRLDQLIRDTQEIKRALAFVIESIKQEQEAAVMPEKKQEKGA